VTEYSATATRGLSVLSLRFQVLDGRLDWPVVQVLVDDADPFAEIAPDWRGFDPAMMLGSRSPLLPEDQGRRVAVYCCSCGEAGCGVIAPVIVPSPDGRRVSWVDFRDYTGVFAGPVEDSVAEREGRAWDLPDIHFDRDQYVAEVQRACLDGSWETSARATARLLMARLEPLDLVLPPDLRLHWAAPAWTGEGIAVLFQHVTREPAYRVREELVRLLSDRKDPVEAAEDMAEQLLSTPPRDWVTRFGGEPPGLAGR
jgi:hypothetical protein